LKESVVLAEMTDSGKPFQVFVCIVLYCFRLLKKLTKRNLQSHSV